MLKSAVETYKAVKQLHEEGITWLAELRREVSTLRDVNELADIALAMRESEKLADDLRKQLKQFRETAETACCALWVKEHVNDEEITSIQTAHVTATPEVTMACGLPSRKKEPENFAKLMEFLKVPLDLCGDEEEAGPVSVNWPRMVEHLSALQSQGLPLPPGIDPAKRYPIYRLSPMRRRKEVDA